MATAEYHRNWYHKKSPEWKQRKTSLAYERRNRNRQFLSEYKSKKSCEKCGESHSSCLEFHHLVDKTIEVSDAVCQGWSIKRIQEEINKCQILCANCHRKEHS